MKKEDESLQLKTKKTSIAKVITQFLIVGSVLFILSECQSNPAFAQATNSGKNLLEESKKEDVSSQIFSKAENLIATPPTFVEKNEQEYFEKVNEEKSDSLSKEKTGKNSHFKEQKSPKLQSVIVDEELEQEFDKEEFERMSKEQLRDYFVVKFAELIEKKPNPSKGFKEKKRQLEISKTSLKQVENLEPKEFSEKFFKTPFCLFESAEFQEIDPIMIYSFAETGSGLNPEFLQIEKGISAKEKVGLYGLLLDKDSNKNDYLSKVAGFKVDVEDVKNNCKTSFIFSAMLKDFIKGQKEFGRAFIEKNHLQDFEEQVRKAQKFHDNYLKNIKSEFEKIKERDVSP